MLLLVVASDWVQLPTVEPGGKIKFKQRPHDNEADFQSQSPEPNRRKDETQMKVETMNPINKFLPAGTSDILTDQFTIKRITKHNIENGQSETQVHNLEPNLNENDPVIKPSVPESHNSKLNSYDSTESNHEAQILEEMVTFIQPSPQWSLKSASKIEASDITISQFKIPLTSNLTSNFPPRSSLEITPMQEDAKFHNPMTINHHSNFKGSASKFSHTSYETNITPDPTVRSINENPERIKTSTESNISRTESESEASWLSGTGTSNSTEENIVQEASSPFDMFTAVHRTLIQETPTTITGKMHFLQQLKDKMLHYMGKVIISAD